MKRSVLDRLQEESRRRHFKTTPVREVQRVSARIKAAKKRPKVVKQVFTERVSAMCITKQAKIALYAAQIDKFLVFHE